VTRTDCPKSAKTTYHRDGTVTIWDTIRKEWFRGTAAAILRLHPGTCWRACEDNARLERIAKREASTCDCGQITGTQCAKRADIVIAWVPPQSRGESKASGSWQGLTESIHCADDCADELEHDAWVGVCR